MLCIRNGPTLLRRGTGGIQLFHHRVRNNLVHVAVQKDRRNPGAFHRLDRVRLEIADAAAHAKHDVHGKPGNRQPALGGVPEQRRRIRKRAVRNRTAHLLRDIVPAGEQQHGRRAHGDAEQRNPNVRSVSLDQQTDPAHQIILLAHAVGHVAAAAFKQRALRHREHRKALVEKPLERAAVIPPRRAAPSVDRHGNAFGAAVRKESCAKGHAVFGLQGQRFVRHAVHAVVGRHAHLHRRIGVFARVRENLLRLFAVAAEDLFKDAQRRADDRGNGDRADADQHIPIPFHRLTHSYAAASAPACGGKDAA